MKPFLPPNYPHGLIVYDEYDIALRNSFVALITLALKWILLGVNPVIKFMQIETSALTPPAYLKAHIEANFELIRAEKLYLRPETTRGTYEALKLIYPQREQLKKALPVCVWQVGKSFRNEQNRPFPELRFKEFYQLEYQLVYAENTRVDYHGFVMSGLSKYLPTILGVKLSSETVDNLPHYSSSTTDLYAAGHEIVAISNRNDFDYPVLEISCGLDRLCAIATTGD